jgi:hypothetical protein
LSATNNFRLDAFGLAIESDWPLTGSRPRPASARGAPAELGERLSTRVARLSSNEFDAQWAKSSEPVFERMHPGGRTRVLIEKTGSHYLLSFDVYGRFIVSIDGREVACEAAGQLVPQERVLFAQVLPLAAVLNGFEVLHGSAVVAAGGVAAFVGASGTGKTTLASRLVLRGAELVTDDVVTLERTADGPIAHPGPPMMAVVPDDEAPPDAGPLPGRALGRTDKLHVSVPTARRALPLRALYYLEPSGTFALSVFAAPDLRQLLGAAFVPYLMTPERLRGTPGDDATARRPRRPLPASGATQIAA